MKKFTALTLALLVSSSAFAADWKVVGTTEDSTVSINNEAVTRDEVSGVTFVVVSFVYPKGKVSPNGSWVYNEVVSQEFYNCKTHKHATRQVFYYSGAVVVSKTDDVLTSWDDVLPGSIGAAVLKAVCPGTQT